MEQDFFEGLDQAKDRLERARRASGLAAVADGFRVLAGLSDLLNSPIDRFDDVLAAVLDATIKITGADRGFLMLYGDDDRLEVKLARGFDFGREGSGEARFSRSIVEEVARAGEGVCIGNIEDSKRFADQASVLDLKLLSVMCVPLQVTLREPTRPPAGGESEKRAAATVAAVGQRKILGVIYVDSRSVKTTFAPQDLELFQALANVATTAILNARVFREATTDELTGLSTRRHLERRLRDELSIARRAKAPLAVLLMDVDRLRDVNREHGYQAGDEVLRGIARTLRAKTRAHDTCARYGGEEFAVVLPQTDAEGAEEVARKLIVSISSEKLVDAPQPVQISVGIAMADSDDTVERILRRADQALSRSKEEGGGRARLFAADVARVTPKADKLAGIFTGDQARAYRNVLIFLEAVPAIHSGRGLDQVLPLVVDSVVELARADRGFLFLRNERGGLTPRVARDRRRKTIAEAEGYDLAVVERVVETGEPLAAKSVQPAGTVIQCVPLAIRGEKLGAIYLETRVAASPAPGGPGPRSSERDESALAYLDAFARQAAIAIENARLEEEIAEKARKIEKLMRAKEEQLAEKERALETEALLAVGSPGEGDDADLVARKERLELKYKYDKIVGESKSMRRVFKLLDRVTDSSVPVFIHGESGTGKELVAKAIHFNGPRKRGRFIAENCAALSETLLESELFGYVKGAFTGAATDKRGLFELATGGTIFLDEVGDMTPAMQMKLLRVLQENEVRRVGGKETIKIDVRVISASNKDLKKLVEEGKFRSDLYYRLNVVSIDLPPLRERREDIPLLVEHFLKEGTEGRPPKRVIREAMDVLGRYPWPGNIRELRNVIERAKIIAEREIIGPDAIILDSAYDLGGGVTAFPERTVASAIEAASARAAAARPSGPVVVWPAEARERRADAAATAVARAPGSARPGADEDEGDDDGEDAPGGSGGGGEGEGEGADRGALTPREELLSPARHTAPPPPPTGFAIDPALEPLYFSLNERQRKLVEYLSRYGSIRNRDYYKIMGVSKSTGWRDLKDLMDRNIVLVHGKGKGSAYSLAKGGAREAR